MQEKGIVHSEQVFVSDITYIPMFENLFAYAAFITDAFSQKIMSACFYCGRPFSISSKRKTKRPYYREKGQKKLSSRYKEFFLEKNENFQCGRNLYKQLTK